MTRPSAQPALTGQVLADAESVAGLLRTELPAEGRLGVAYSGGVDSATLLALAVRALGSARVVALLGVSPSLAARERATAHQEAARIGAEVVEIPTHEGEDPDYIANDVDRCFHCKDELFTRIDDDVAADQGLDAVAYGENADDALRRDRPGARAAAEHAVLRPLAEAGMDKARVREAARQLGLSVADKPAAPCLASRIPHGESVTPQKLAQVEALEAAAADQGFSDSRARHHGTVARLELPVDELPRALEPDVRAALVRAGREAGFAHVSIDLGGLQSGAFTLQILNARGSLSA